MIKYNRGSYRESLEKGKNLKKSIHTASIHLKQNDSYTDAYYLPLREVVQKKIEDKSNRSFIKSKSKDKCVKLDKSSSNIKIDNKQKQNFKCDDKIIDYKFKILRESTQMETDRKSFKKSVDKSRTLRLKTDHTQSYKNSEHQLSYKQNESDLIQISASELGRLKDQMNKISEQNERLKKQLAFFMNSELKQSDKGINSVLKALKF